MGKKSVRTIVKPGFVVNPLKKFPNIECFCDSKKKAKDCCGRYPHISVKQAVDIEAILIFYEHKNGDKKWAQKRIDEIRQEQDKKLQEKRAARSKKHRERANSLTK